MLVLHIHQGILPNPGTYAKIASDLGLGDDFRPVLRLPPPVTSGKSRLSSNMPEKVTKNEIRNP